MPKKGSAGAPPIQGLISEKIAPLVLRMDFFEKSLCDIHPAYASRTLDNMKELADGTVQNANKILSCINNQRQAVDEAVLKAQCVQRDTAVSIRKLDDAAKRHRDDAAALRAELAQLKEVISKSASDCQACYEACSDSEAKCEDAKLHCLKTVANLHARMSAHTRQSEEFKCGQYHVVNRARSRSASVRELVVEAQAVAQSRSPSASRSYRTQGSHRQQSTSSFQVWAASPIDGSSCNSNAEAAATYHHAPLLSLSATSSRSPACTNLDAVCDAGPWCATPEFSPRM